MPMVMAIDDVKPENIRQRRIKGDGSDPGGHHVNFFRPTPDKPRDPDAFLVQYAPGGTSSAHCHTVDEFQVVVNGEGDFGRHHVSAYTVHYARAYTPYGPLSSRSGWGFLTLRIDKDAGSMRDFQKMKQVPGRQPWQVSRKAEFPPAGALPVIAPIPDISDEQGLFAHTLTAPPHGRISAPDPAQGRGQYIVPVKGSLVYEGREHKALAVVFIKSDEGPFTIQAGERGLEALVMNFPRTTTPVAHAESNAPGSRKWKCALCSFAYDEALGMPEDGIAPGTRWADVPETWSCPDCSASKNDFQMISVS